MLNRIPNSIPQTIPASNDFMEVSVSSIGRFSKMASQEYDVSRWVALEHPLDSLAVLATGMGELVASVLGDKNAANLPGGDLSNWVSNMPLLGDLHPPLTEQQARYIAANNSGAGPLLNETQAQKDAKADEVWNYVKNNTADTRTWDGIKSGWDSLFPSVPDFSMGGLGSIVVPIILVCAAAFAVFVVVRKL